MPKLLIQVVDTDGTRAPVDGNTGLYVNPACLDASNDQVGLGATADQDGALESVTVVNSAGVAGTNLKNSAGRLYGWHITNLTTTLYVVRAYNTTGSATVGTDTPKLTIPVLPSDWTFMVPSGPGVPFSAGISYGHTNAIGTTSTGAVAASALAINWFYK